MGPMNKLEQFHLQVDALEELRQGAIDETKQVLDEARNEVKRLEAMLAHLTGEALAVGPKRRSRDPDLPCHVCKFVTVPNHDVRTHKFQHQHKKPLTTDELRARKMTKKQTSLAGK